MKKALVIAGFLLVVLGSSSANPVGVSFDMFYSSLSPHGEWIQCNDGVYAWRPSGVTAGWRPYYDGRWCWTDDGWYWASDEPWAWATYHYGRWYFDDANGWVWIPGYDWAPAWVEWRYGGDCVGWAPLSPYAVFSMNFGIHYRSYWITPHFWWSFVDCRYITDPYLHRYVYRPEHNTRYIGRTRSAGSVRYTGGRITTRGPERGYVEQRGNIRVERAEIRDVGDVSGARVVRDGERERVDVYRPKIEERTTNGDNVRPDRVRQVDKNIGLDTKNLDVRSREVDRESGRDMRRAEDIRRRDDAQVQRSSQFRARAREDNVRQRDEEQQRSVDRSGERRANTYDRERRKEERREARQSAPDVKSRRSESTRVDRAPSRHTEPQRSGRSGESRSRDGGGRKR